MSRAGYRRGQLALALFAALAGIVAGSLLAACAGPQAPAAYERIDERKQEIHMLWAQIRAWRQDAGLRGVEPPRGEIIKMQDQPMELAKNVCPDDVEPATRQCRDVCSLAEAICDNAESICRIASELAGDSWAQGKCASAKASCKEAKKECCRCHGSEMHDAVMNAP